VSVCYGLSHLMKSIIIFCDRCEGVFIVIFLLFLGKHKMLSIYITFRAGIMFLIIMLSSCGGFFRYCYTGYRPQIIVHQITNYVPLPTDRSCPEERQGLVVSRFSHINFCLILGIRIEVFSINILFKVQV